MTFQLKIVHNRLLLSTIVLLILGIGILSLAANVLPAEAQGTPPVVPTATLPPPPRPQPVSSNTVEDITLELYFEAIQQGRAGLLRVEGENIAGARIRFYDSLIEFYPGDDGAYYGLLAINMDQTPRSYDFSVLAWREDDTRVTIPATVEVRLGGFVRYDFNISPDKAYLIEPQVERTEFAKLASLLENSEPQPLWDDSGFHLPIQSDLTSQFGQYRLINGTVETRHTGWDMRAPTGTPITSMAAGKVVFAGAMDIRGNYVLIDHGNGIFTGYAHFSQIHVTSGQSVVAGQIIGLAGNTGRSGGAHLHWEMNINGEWIDGVDFLQMWLP